MLYKFLYGIGQQLFVLFLKGIGQFNGKISRMLLGRAETRQTIFSFRKKNPSARLFWFHAASVGEFEQALPVMQKVKQNDPHCLIGVSFFSPSGMEQKGNHPLCDLRFYLPADTPGRMQELVSELRPAALILVKYEYWFHLLSACQTNEVPVFSICCILRENSFRNFFLKQHLNHCLPLFRHFFIQNEETGAILSRFGIRNFTVCGDTRIDRVLDIKGQNEGISWLDTWKKEQQLFLIGSAWEEDLEFLREYINRISGGTDPKWKVLIVPHEVSEKHLLKMESVLTFPCNRFSVWDKNQEDCKVLLLDKTGLLSRAYRYADAAWVGGAFKTGLHNVAEAAVYGIPVGFGPSYKKFREASDLIAIGLARSFRPGEFPGKFFEEFQKDGAGINEIRKAADAWFQSQKGSSKIIAEQLLPG